MVKTKTVGRRKQSSGGLMVTDNLLKLVIALRGNKPFYPRGVYKFKSFEEKEAWALKMKTR